MRGGRYFLALKSRKKGVLVCVAMDMYVPELRAGLTGQCGDMGALCMDVRGTLERRSKRVKVKRGLGIVVLEVETRCVCEAGGCLPFVLTHFTFWSPRPIVRLSPSSLCKMQIERRGDHYPSVDSAVEGGEGEEA